MAKKNSKKNVKGLVVDVEKKAGAKKGKKVVGKVRRSNMSLIYGILMLAVLIYGFVHAIAFEIGEGLSIIGGVMVIWIVIKIRF